MYGRATLILLLLLAPFFDSGNPGTPLSRILAVYHHADELFHLSNTTPASDSTALAGFSSVIDELSKTPVFAGRDTLLFQSWLKKGILLDAALNYSDANTAYCKALDFHPPNDSLTYVTYIFTGASYYNLNNFDSANYFLLRAESMATRFKTSEDKVRLYNTLGVLYYDNGNYRQANNYFTRALGMVKEKQPLDTASAVSLQTNIATCYFRLGQYEDALSLYRQILAYHVFASYIYMNMGRAYAGLERYQEALSCFRRVDGGKIPWVYNEIGNTQWQLHRADSCAWYLDQLPVLARKKGITLNELDLGINAMYRADMLTGEQKYIEALTSLQHAIVIFSRNFSNQDIYTNPSGFTGTFAYYGLFDALVKKAALFKQLFTEQPKEKYLSASYEAYQAALSLFRFIERSYDTDDAKLFLKKNGERVHESALAVCLQLYHRHPDAGYLEQAFIISEKSKASIITANLEENAFTNRPGMGKDLLRKEKNIKYNIARLNVASEGAGEKDRETIAREKAGYEMELSRLQKELEQNGDYYKLKYQDAAPGIKELQQHLDKSQALISFYAADSALQVFALTSSSFTYTRIDSLTGLQHLVEDWLNTLKTTENGRKFRGDAIGERLYQRLIKPIQAILPQKEEWIIIPDGFLYFLPFESLPAGNGPRRLLETTTISYRFSSQLLTASHSRSTKEPVTILAFAPFAGKGATLDQPASTRPTPAQPPHNQPASTQPALAQSAPDQPTPAWYNRLPASAEEIAGLPGTQYIDSLATKQRFLQSINKYPIIHLATHAVSSVNNSAASFIAFYPEKRSHLEDRLFLEELYGLDMSATQLVIISACETGQGELAGKEGVISLARAFAYAGCASTINSLWKADDKATSFILRRFYEYLKKGHNKARALQEAKLDYLNSDALNKSPAYWAHLVLVGDTSPVYTKGFSWYWVIAPLTLGMIFLIIVMRRKRKKKKSTFFKNIGEKEGRK